MTTTAAAKPIAFTASAHNTVTSGTSVAVTTPTAVSAGDTELLSVTTTNATAKRDQHARGLDPGDHREFAALAGRGLREERHLQ